MSNYNNPTEFLESFMSYTHARGKIVVDSRYKIDVFEDCLHFYSDKSGRIRQFPLNRIVLLYAISGNSAENAGLRWHMSVLTRYCFSWMPMTER